MEETETDVHTAAGHKTATKPSDLLASLSAVKTHVADITEADFGLLEELLKLGVVTRRELAKVRSKSTVYERNDAMLEKMTSEEQCSKFLTALERTSQVHVVNYIRYGEGAKAQCGDVRPLDEARMLQLTVNGTQLVDRIDSDTAFVTELANAGCITWRQREHLLGIQHGYQRNDMLLEFLTRRSVADYNKFTDLLANYQPGLSQLLINGGVAVSLDAELDQSSVDDVNEVEERVVSQWRELRELIPDAARGELRQRLHDLDVLVGQFGLHTRLVLLEKGNSIAMCFICMLLDALAGLRELWRSDQLKLTVESLFTLLSDARQTVRVKRLSWPQAHYGRCLNFFIQVSGEANHCSTITSVARIPTTMLCIGVRTEERMMVKRLPLEMLELVLSTAFHMLYASEWEDGKTRHDQPPLTSKSLKTERQAFVTLASVSSFFWQTLVGWPQSATSRWVRHKLRKSIRSSFASFKRKPQHLQSQMVKGDVCGMTRLDSTLYAVCKNLSVIQTFDADSFIRGTDIDVKGLSQPRDIAACHYTGALYVADWDNQCVWRVSTRDDNAISQWLPTTSMTGSFYIEALSVTARHLLVTSWNQRCLRQFNNVDADQTADVQLPDNWRPYYAVATHHESFIVNYEDTSQGWHFAVSEISEGGVELRRCPLSLQRLLGAPHHLSVYSDGRVLVIDYSNDRILLLSSTLQLQRVLIDTSDTDSQVCYRPHRLCAYNGQLTIAHSSSIMQFSNTTDILSAWKIKSNLI